MDPPTPDSAADLAKRRDKAMHAGSEKAVARQHARNKMTARERIDYLLDDGSFNELGLFVRHQATGMGVEEDRPYTDGVVTGWGAVEGRPVFLFAQDFTVFGGSLGEANARKVHEVMDMAARTGAPLVGLNDGAGARIQEGVVSLVSYGGIFCRNSQFSGRIPQISVIMGPCAGGAVYSPALTDFVFMVEESSYMFLTGPDVVRTVTGETVSLQELGGALTHASRSGVAHFTAPDDKTCLDEVRRLLGYLPSNSASPAPWQATADPAGRRTPELDGLLPGHDGQPYDMMAVIRAVVDDGEMFEYSPLWARNIVCCLARIDGHPVGIVANQPEVLAGVIDIEASEKAARFVRTCDAFNLPLVALVDAPGFLPAPDQEVAGILRHGSKLLYAFCEATVPRIQVVVRKAYGGAYVVMNSKSTGADLAFAWPSAELAVMGPMGAVEILHHRELEAEEGDDRRALRAKLAHEYAEDVATPYRAAERGYIDDVIEPADTRAALARGLAVLRAKRADRQLRKHGNVPL